MRSAAAALLVALGAAAAFGATPAMTANVTYRNHFGSLKFNRPLAFAPYPGEDSAYVVVEQVGVLRTVERKNNAWAKTDSARIQVPVVTSIATGVENNKCTVGMARATSAGITAGLYESRGLLGFAFHPNFRANRKYYASYVTVRDSSGATHERSIVAEFVAGPGMRPRTGDSTRILIDVCQPYWDHKGGGIEFGPDGKLYFALGDGGDQDQGASPENPAQRKKAWLGKMLRIDVDAPPDSGKPYAVPADNPFVGDPDYLPEIWALGLRNPWKWHFHPVTGELWAGNIGWVRRDDILRIPRGGNMGWNVWEGNYCHMQDLCYDSAYRFVPPMLSTVHGGVSTANAPPNGGRFRSITGGAFFLGDTTSPFHGVYFFGDYIENAVWAARFVNGAMADSVRLANLTHVVSFDRDAAGRLFATSLGTGNVTANTGTVYILESPDLRPAPNPVRLATAPGESRPSIPLSRILQNPENYVITGLNGRKIRGVPSTGAFLVRERGQGGPPRLVSAVR